MFIQARAKEQTSAWKVLAGIILIQYCFFGSYGTGIYIQVLTALSLLVSRRVYARWPSRQVVLLAVGATSFSSLLAVWTQFNVFLYLHNVVYAITEGFVLYLPIMFISDYFPFDRMGRSFVFVKALRAALVSLFAILSFKVPWLKVDLSGRLTGSIEIFLKLGLCAFVLVFLLYDIKPVRQKLLEPGRTLSVYCFLLASVLFNLCGIMELSLSYSLLEVTIRNPDLSFVYASILAMALSIICMLVLGYLSDRRGALCPIIVAVACGVLSCFLAWVSGKDVRLAFILAGTGIGISKVGVALGICMLTRYIYGKDNFVRAYAIVALSFPLAAFITTQIINMILKGLNIPLTVSSVVDNFDVFTKALAASFNGVVISFMFLAAGGLCLLGYKLGQSGKYRTEASA